MLSTEETLILPYPDGPGPLTPLSEVRRQLEANLLEISAFLHSQSAEAERCDLEIMPSSLRLAAETVDRFAEGVRP